MTTCGNGHENLEGQHFCGQCGAELTAAARSGESETHPPPATDPSTSRDTAETVREDTEESQGNATQTAVAGMPDDAESSKRRPSSSGPSKAWYLLPWLFPLLWFAPQLGAAIVIYPLVAGAIGWLVVRHVRSMRVPMLANGVVAFFVGLILPFLLLVAIFASWDRALNGSAASNTNGGQSTVSNGSSQSPETSSPFESPTTSETSSAGNPPPTVGAVPQTGAANGAGTYYGITGDVTIYQSPQTNSAAVGSIAAGTSVQVSCITTGDTVPGPYGPDYHWDEVTYNGVRGFVTDEYVDTKDNAHNGVIPTC
jgi:hypothetical protein